MALGLALAGCALTEKAPPVEIRYFNPLPTEERPAPAEPEGETQRGLRMGRITASAHLRSRISYRKTSYELGAYETLRWTDIPESYLRRALHRGLFETQRFAERSGGREPTLEVELLAFEEVRRGGKQYGFVALHYSLRDEHGTLADGHIEIEKRAPAGKGIEPVVAAISAALEAAAEETSLRVAAAIDKRGS